MTHDLHRLHILAAEGDEDARRALDVRLARRGRAWLRCGDVVSGVCAGDLLDCPVLRLPAEVAMSAWWLAKRRALRCDYPLKILMVWPQRCMQHDEAGVRRY